MVNEDKMSSSEDSDYKMNSSQGSDLYVEDSTDKAKATEEFDEAEEVPPTVPVTSQSLAAGDYEEVVVSDDDGYSVEEEMVEEEGEEDEQEESIEEEYSEEEVVEEAEEKAIDYEAIDSMVEEAKSPEQADTFETDTSGDGIHMYESPSRNGQGDEEYEAPADEDTAHSPLIAPIPFQTEEEAPIPYQDEEEYDSTPAYESYVAPVVAPVPIDAGGITEEDTPGNEVAAYSDEMPAQTDRAFVAAAYDGTEDDIAVEADEEGDIAVEAEDSEEEVEEFADFNEAGFPVAAAAAYSDLEAGATGDVSEFDEKQGMVEQSVQTDLPWEPEKKKLTPVLLLVVLGCLLLIALAIVLPLTLIDDDNNSRNLPPVSPTPTGPVSSGYRHGSNGLYFSALTFFS